MLSGGETKKITFSGGGGGAAENSFEMATRAVLNANSSAENKTIKIVSTRFIANKFSEIVQPY